MKKLLLILLVFGGQLAFAMQEIERYAIIAGVNYGGTKRELLKYAHTDAQNVSSVLQEIGGVPAEHQTVLLEPTIDQFNAALKNLKSTFEKNESKNKREVLLYFSGHANEKGLIFGNDNYDYRVLRADIDSIPANVKITVLDACASGAITRMKGGYRKQAFLVNASNNLNGYAFITSSTNNEGSQESDLIGASFFTHYLVSGMRGAADVSQDGVITLGEAYQFAFNETLTRTQNTSGGAQHPSYDMKLSGSGDIVMSDLRNTDRSIVFGKDVTGRIYIKKSDGTLVTELYKAQGRVVELGLSDATYTVVLEESNTWRESQADLKSEVRVIIKDKDFIASAVEHTRLRGDVVDQSSEMQRVSGKSEGGSAWGARVGLAFDEVGTVDLISTLQYKNLMFQLSGGINTFSQNGGQWVTGIGLGYLWEFNSLNVGVLLHEYWVYSSYEHPGWTKSDAFSNDELLTRLSGIVETNKAQGFSVWAGLSVNLLANFDKMNLVKPWGSGLDESQNIAKGLYWWPGVQFGFNYTLF